MKDKQINLRVSEELYNTLQIKAKAVDLNVSKYIRSAILESDIKPDNSKDIARLIGEVKKIGNNINQIAYNLNIANLNGKLNDINYNAILDEMIVIKYYLNELANANI